MSRLRPVRPVDPLILAAALRGQGASPSVGQARIQDTRVRNIDRLQRLDRPVLASGPGNAALIGLMNGVSKYLARQRGEKDLDQAYAAFRAEETARAQQESQAAAADREYRRAEEERLYQRNRRDALADQQRGRQWAVEDREAAETAKANAPVSRKEQLELEKLQAQVDNTRSTTAARDAEEERNASEAANMAEERDSTVAMMNQSIDYMLAPENRGALRAATGSIQGALPSVRQEVVDWENRFNFVQSALTADKLDLMTGVLSESDIRILRQLAAGGLTLRSSEDEIIGALEAFRRGSNALEGQSPSMGTGGIPSGVTPDEWGAMTPEEQALWQN